MLIGYESIEGTLHHGMDDVIVEVVYLDLIQEVAVLEAQSVLCDKNRQTGLLKKGGHPSQRQCQTLNAPRPCGSSTNLFL